jgi:transcriptional regulator with XRE-family HTH domain
VNKDSIGANIRRLRQARCWTQEQLASAAQLDVRTIQRAEGGQLIAAETLQAIAGAFDEPLESLSLPPIDLEKVAAAIQARYSIIALHPIDRATAMEPLLLGSHAFSYHKLGLTTDVDEDLAAEFEQLLRDTLDIWSDIEPIQRRDLVRHLQDKLDALREHGLVVTAGTQGLRPRMSTGTGSIVFHVIYVAVSPAAKPVLFLARDKAEPVSFSA